MLDDDVGDLEDIVVPLWRGLKDEKEFKKLLCRETTSRCGKERKPVKEREDLEFNRQEKTLLDTERMMENMKDQGMPMVMQSREDMMEELYEQMEPRVYQGRRPTPSWSRSRAGLLPRRRALMRPFLPERRNRTTTRRRRGSSKYLTHMTDASACLLNNGSKLEL